MLSGVITSGWSGPGSNGYEEVLHIPQSSTDWSFAIRLFNVIFRTLIEGILPDCIDAVPVFYNPSQLV